MNYIRKNKITIFVIMIFIVLLIMGVEIKKILVPDSGKAVYGNRLEEIDAHPLAKNLGGLIDEKLKTNENVVGTSYKLHGKIINIIITVKDEVSVSDAKVIASSTLELFSNNELDYYSLNVYVKKENEELNNFPIEGYKDPESEDLVFVKDREMVVEETNEEE